MKTFLEKQAGDQGMSGVPPLLPRSLKTFLEKYVGDQIGINCKEAAKFHAAKLVGAHDDYFTVELANPGLTVHYPYSQLIFVSESLAGFTVMEPPSASPFAAKVRLILQVQMLLIPTGTGGGVGLGVGVGFAF